MTILILGLLLFLTLGATCASALFQRWVRLSAGSFAVVYLLAVRRTGALDNL